MARSPSTNPRRRRWHVELAALLATAALVPPACAPARLDEAPLVPPEPGVVRVGPGAPGSAVELPVLHRLRADLVDALGEAIVPEALRPQPDLAVRPIGSSRLTVYRWPPTEPWLSFPAANPWGQRQTFMVTATKERRGRPAWYRVQLPVQENGMKGWVRAKDVELVVTRHRVVIDRSKFRLTWYRNGKILERFNVGLGRAGFTTPVGKFYVWGHAPQRSSYGPYGIHAIALSVMSTVMYGRVAIHGTADPADAGRRVSHGCIRVYNPDVLKLKRLPIGTPVIIKG